MKSHNRIPISRILIGVIAVLAVVAICVELLVIHSLQGKEDASPEASLDANQALTEHDSETTPEDADAPEASEPQSPTESGETEPAAEESGSGSGTAAEHSAQNDPAAGRGDPQAEVDSEDSPEPTEEIASGDITCDEFGIFSGQFVEDGRDELVENVAAVLVTNRTDRFLDFATLSFDIDGQTATFILSGLPAGRSAWVMEATRMTATSSSVFTYQNCVNSFRDDVTASTDKVAISSDGNMLTAVNNTSETLEDVFVYYRTLHTDGNFLGGITYRADFGTLEPGASVETMAGHFNKETSEIVRVGWQEG